MQHSSYDCMWALRLRNFNEQACLALSSRLAGVSLSKWSTSISLCLSPDPTHPGSTPTDRFQNNPREARCCAAQQRLPCSPLNSNKADWWMDTRMGHGTTVSRPCHAHTLSKCHTFFKKCLETIESCHTKEKQVYLYYCDFCAHSYCKSSRVNSESWLS